MVLNYIWVAFFVIAFVVAVLKFIITGDTVIFKTIVDATFASSEFAVMGFCLPLVGAMTLWLGILNVGEKAGAINFLARIVGPFFSKIFPGIPKNHPANGQVIMNFSANMLGLDNSATPIGLKAMDSMQELNPEKDTASNAQIMFLVLNTSGLTIIPITILAQRAILHSVNPADVFIPILLATYFSTMVGLITVSIWQKINLFDKVVLSWLLGIGLFIGLLIWYFSSLDAETLSRASLFLANFTILLIIVSFILGAVRKKVNVFEAFIDGAKSGFETAVRVIPYVIAMLVGIAVFRASGAMGYLTNGIGSLVEALGFNTDFVDALPVAFMKPLSGGGAKAMAVDAMTNFGVDSFVGRLSCVFQGAADTTFFILALYFGSVGIKKTRYAVVAGLIADLAGIIAAIYISYLFFH